MFFEKRYLETVDNFIFISNTTKHEVEKLLNKKVKGITAFPGKDHILKKKIKNYAYTRNNVLKILFIGNLYPNKGLDILIKALALIDKNKWFLTVIGNIKVDKIYTNQIKKLIENKKLNENITFKGFIPNDELYMFFKKNHVLIVPSYYESLGIVYIEALSFGIPVIASDVGGVKEIITIGKEGYLIKSGDINQLKKHIVNLMNNPQILKTMKNNALDKYNKLPTWKKSMEEIWKYIHSL